MKIFSFKLPAFVALLLILPMLKVSANKVVITVENYSFSPASISNVSVGDTIHWEWLSGSHTTTSTSVPSGAAAWNSPLNSSNASFEYKVTVAGVYNYKCTPHASMGMVAAFTASSVNGIMDKTSVFGELNISPNPASELVKVSFSPDHSFKGSIQLRNLLGSTLWKSDDEFESGSNNIEIGLANIPKGLYFILLQDDRNNRFVKRLIVQ